MQFRQRKAAVLALEFGRGSHPRRRTAATNVTSAARYPARRQNARSACRRARCWSTRCRHRSGGPRAHRRMRPGRTPRARAARARRRSRAVRTTSRGKGRGEGRAVRAALVAAGVEPTTRVIPEPASARHKPVAARAPSSGCSWTACNSHRADCVGCHAPSGRERSLRESQAAGASSFAEHQRG
jgi:hypothetical protein